MKKESIVHTKATGFLFFLLALFVVVAGCEKDPITVERTSPKAILEFKFENSLNDDLSEEIGSSVSEGNLTARATVPFGTRIRALVPTIAVSDGATISPASGVVQDFRAPFTYVVTGQDGTAFSYRVIVTFEEKPSSTATLSVQYGTKNIVKNDGADVFVAVLPASVDLSKVPLTLAVSSGATLKEGTAEVALEEGAVSKEFDFSSALSKTFTVTAQDGTTTKDYMVEVLAKTATSNEVLAFAFLKSSNPAFPADAFGTIDKANNTVSIEIPAGIALDNLIPTIVHTGKSVLPDPAEPADFTNPVAYTVTAENDTDTQQYMVSVTSAQYKGNNLSVKFEYKNKEGTQDVTEDVSGIQNSFLVILPLHVQNKTTAKLILSVSEKATLAEGTTALTLAKNTITQDFDFSSSLSKTFTVTSEEGTAKDYTIVLNARGVSTKAILSFVFLGSNNATFNDDDLTVIGIIDESAKTITATVPELTNIAMLTPTIRHNGESISPGNETEQDFRPVLGENGQVKYTVTDSEKQEQEYSIIIIETGV